MHSAQGTALWSLHKSKAYQRDACRGHNAVRHTLYTSQWCILAMEPKRLKSSWMCVLPALSSGFRLLYFPVKLLLLLLLAMGPRTVKALRLTAAHLAPSPRQWFDTRWSHPTRLHRYCLVDPICGRSGSSSPSSSSSSLTATLQTVA